MREDDSNLETIEAETWVRPRIESLGRLRDFVQGSGKMGSNADMDPQSTFKGGGG